MSNQWKELSDGYGQSKWVAEQMCMQARSRGLPVSILRPGNMSPSARTGVWNPSDFIYMLLQVGGSVFPLLLGVAPMVVRSRIADAA